MKTCFSYPLGLLLAVAGLTASLPSLNAAVLAQYDFEEATGPFASWDTELHSTAGIFTSGTGISSLSQRTVGDTTSTPFASSAATGNSGTDVNSGGFLSNNASATTESGAVTANSYLAFTITPEANYSLNLTSLDFKLLIGSVTGSAEGYFVRSSVDGFASSLASGTITTRRTTDGAFQLASVDLSGPGFQNLNSATEFRFYIYNPDGITLNSFNYIDKVQLQGMAVPEPGVSTLALLGGLFALSCLKRRNRPQTR